MDLSFFLLGLAFVVTYLPQLNPYYLSMEELSASLQDLDLNMEKVVEDPLKPTHRQLYEEVVALNVKVSATRTTFDSGHPLKGHESRSFVKQQLSVHGENLMENVHAHPGASLNALSETLREPIQLPRARKQQSESSNIVHNDFKTDSVIKKQEDEEAQDTLGMNPVHVERDDDEKEKEDADGDDVVFPKSDRFIVRMRGLPWSAQDNDIRSFFKREQIKEIQIVYLSDGRSSGEALVEFVDAESYKSSFHKNHKHIGHRYIEIFKGTATEIDTASGRASLRPVRPPKSKYVIRMRGLPYTATDEDVMNFFANAKPTGVHLIKDDLGRPSGEGFVELGCDVSVMAAMAKHRHHMGPRYIEVFRSSPTELMRALGLTSRWQPQNGSSYKSSCLLMRGLPYSCTESDITKFFQKIEVTPIRIHRKADGAEAYVEFCNVMDTDNAMTRHRSYIGNRYIELFRVSYQQMASTVGLPSAPATGSGNNVIPHSIHRNNVMATPAMNQAQSMVMPTNLSIPPLSITPHYGSMQTHYAAVHQHAQYNGHYVANPLLSATNVTNPLLTFQNMSNHGNGYYRPHY